MWKNNCTNQTKNQIGNLSPKICANFEKFDRRAPPSEETFRMFVIHTLYCITVLNGQNRRCRRRSKCIYTILCLSEPSYNVTVGQTLSK